MAIHIQWDDDEQTTIRYDIPAEWTIEGLVKARQQVFRWMDESDHEKIYAIANFIDRKVSIPKDAMTRFNELSAYSHPRAGLTVVVGAGGVMRAIFGGLKRLFTGTTGKSVDFAYANTLEQARALIAEAQS